MNKKRLKEIKDSIDFQLSVCDLEEYEVSKLLAEEEKELYDEVIRLNNIINELEKMLEEGMNYSDYYEGDLSNIYEEIYDYLQELKENNDEKEKQ